MWWPARAFMMLHNVPLSPLPFLGALNFISNFRRAEEVEKYDLKTQVEGNLKKQSTAKQGGQGWSRVLGPLLTRSSPTVWARGRLRVQQ